MSNVEAISEYFTPNSASNNKRFSFKSYYSLQNQANKLYVHIYIPFTTNYLIYNFRNAKFAFIFFKWCGGVVVIRSPHDLPQIIFCTDIELCLL